MLRLLHLLRTTMTTTKYTIRPDIRFENHGSTVGIRGLNRVGKAWIKENLQVEDWQVFGGAVIVDHRLAFPIYDGAFNDGLAVGGVL